MLEDLLTEHYATVPEDPDAEARIREAVLGSPTSRRRPVLLAVAASVVVVALVSVGALWIANRPGAHHAATPVTTTSPAVVAPGPSSALYGVSWRDGDAAAHLYFTPGRVVVSNGCVSTTYMVAVSSNRLKLGKEVPPSVACAGPPPPRPGTKGYEEYVRRDAAWRYLQSVLGSHSFWSIARSVLVLTPAAQPGRGLAPVAVVSLTTTGTPLSSLPGTTWLLHSYVAADGSIHDGAAEYSLAFDKGGRFRATDGCVTSFVGAVTGRVVIGVRSLDFTGSRESSSCSFVANGAGASVIEVLSGKAAARIVDGALHITDVDRAIQLVYTRA